jgi:hypothetical protein
MNAENTVSLSPLLFAPVILCIWRPLSLSLSLSELLAHASHQTLAAKIDAVDAAVTERVRSAIEAEAAHTAGLLARELAAVAAQFDASAQQSQLHVMQRIDLVSSQARVGLGDARAIIATNHQ